jgi:hypothetical protein
MSAGVVFEGCRNTGTTQPSCGGARERACARGGSRSIRPLSLPPARRRPRRRGRSPAALLSSTTGDWAARGGARRARAVGPGASRGRGSCATARGQGRASSCERATGGRGERREGEKQEGEGKPQGDDRLSPAANSQRRATGRRGHEWAATVVARPAGEFAGPARALCDQEARAKKSRREHHTTPPPPAKQKRPSSSSLQRCRPSRLRCQRPQRGRPYRRESNADQSLRGCWGARGELNEFGV